MQDYVLMAVRTASFLVQIGMHFGIIAVAAVWVRPAHPHAWVWFLAAGGIGVLESLLFPTIHFVGNMLGAMQQYQLFFAATGLMGIVGSLCRYGCLVRGILLLVGNKQAPSEVAGSPW